MIRDYQIVSPSLDGVLRHDSVIYDGVKRPIEITKILDKSSLHRSFNHSYTLENCKVVEDYLRDLYGILIKRISGFVMDSNPPPDEAVKLQAMLQELIKMKKILIR